jgi:hypothetical protein
VVVFAGIFVVLRKYFKFFSFQTLCVVMGPGTDISAAFLSRFGLNFLLLPWLAEVQARQ